MGLSKTQRIGILLGIDIVFFFIELVVGYAVHSLALVADSFHMLNDVMSLIVGLWAVKRAKSGRTSMYTYGWQRAETIGALVNGVFLLALCLSIFLEAIQRFVEPQVVSNPMLVLVVGCLGLASNIAGLFLFHDHGHGHGGHSHGGHTHSHDSAAVAEEGHSHTMEREQESDETIDESTRLLRDPSGSVEDVLPTVRIAGFKGSKDRLTFSKSDETNTTAESSNTFKKKSMSADDKHHRRSSFFTGSIDAMPIHPAERRGEIINAGHFGDDVSDTATEEAVDMNGDDSLGNGTANGNTTGYGTAQKTNGPKYSHAGHRHRQPREAQSGGGGHGHSHDLNMRGVFLHVVGDALGNIGVIASALIIWLATFPGRYYFDPAISLVITVIIFCSAYPLCKAAARILLQAVPSWMSIDEIKNDIESLEGVKSAHHIHVWQLSDTKLVASLHVRISSEIKNPGTEGYMRLAREIQLCLKEYGIRSSTIQPEFESDAATEHYHDRIDQQDHALPKPPSKTASIQSCGSGNKVCMLDSLDAGAVEELDEHDHEHNADHDHAHDHDHGHDSSDTAHNHGTGKKKHNHQH